MTNCHKSSILFHFVINFLYMKELAEHIKELREEKSLTQSQLAKELGVTQSTIAKWESAERIPSLEFLIKIAKTYHCSIDWLVGLEF